MPIYEYECRHCLRTFEKLILPGQRSDTAPCPHCIGWEGNRIISKSHFRLRGGGWAKDNYCKKED